jgi:transcriptional regulator with XRE-family HTH domain/Zn-dependent peptidase ImmA (M78 family)
MIKNERQYRITKAQIEKFEAALAGLMAGTSSDVHPILVEAEMSAMRSQLDDLQKEVSEYEALLAGERPVLSIDSFDELPLALIQARIATGLSQRELAERLNLKEQQIQRYEATEYSSASLERVQEVVRALGIKVREDIILPQARLSLDTLFSRLRRAGLDSDFVINRLIPRSLRARLEDPDDDADLDTLIARIASAIGRVFGWSSAVIFGSGPLQPNLSIIGATRFKTGARIDEQHTSVYTVYAHILALLVLEGTDGLPRQPIPTDPQILRQDIIGAYGSISFEHALRYIWRLGVPVLPLLDSGAFHGACWRIEGRNVIVLKQQVRSPARWLFDLFHELYHAGQRPDAPDLTVVEGEEIASRRHDDPEELAASQFAGDVLLDGRAHILAEQSVQAANGRLERLKAVVPQIALREGVSADALANYLAFRLTMQGENWWGAANNLQRTHPDPWQIARDLLLKQINLSSLNEADCSLLLQALDNREGEA